MSFERMAMRPKASIHCLTWWSAKTPMLRNGLPARPCVDFQYAEIIEEAGNDTSPAQDFSDVCIHFATNPAP